MEITGEVKHPHTPGNTDNIRPQDQAERAAEAPRADRPQGETPVYANPAESENISQRERLTEILQSYGYKANDKNLAMLTRMLENGLPLTKENVARMNQALKLTDSPDKALFLLLNNIRLTPANAAQLDGLADGRIRISEQLARLMDAIANLPDGPLKETLLKSFSVMENAVLTARPGGTGTAGAASGTLLGQNAPLVNSGALGTTVSTATGAASGIASQGAMPLIGGQTALTPGNFTGNISQIIGESGSQNSGAAGQNAGAAGLQPNATGQNAIIAGLQSNAAGQNTGMLGAPSGTAQTAAVLFAQQDSVTASTQFNGQTSNQSATITTQLIDSMQPAALEQTARLPQNQPNQLNTHAGEATPESVLRTSIETFTEREQPIPPALVPRAAAETQIPLRLSFKLMDSTPGDIDRFLNSLQDVLNQARRAVAEQRVPTPEGERVLRQIQTLSEHMDFVTHIKNQLFVQLPVYYNGQETPTALHIYKDVKGGKKGESGQTQSALIALDTSALGRFETYVQKRGVSVSCQFRLRDKEVEKLVRTHIKELETLLRSYLYSLDTFSFLPPGEPYTLLDTPETLAGQEEGSGGDTAFVFDKRV
jgi:hypothetical protein